MITEVFNQNSKYYGEMMNVILKAKNNPPEKGQVHHIVPKCWFKHYNMEVDDSISNTVLLSWEDHKLVHNLAYKCAKEKWLKSKMACAAHWFGDNEPVIIHSEETRAKISKALKGKKLGPMSEETKKKLSESRKGKKRSEETRRKISESCKGENNPMYGKKRSDETKRKMSESLKGHLPWITGKHHSEESKRKMSEKLKKQSISAAEILGGK